MPETAPGNPNFSTNTQVQAWDNLARDVVNNATPEEAKDAAAGTLDDGVDITPAPFAEPKADQIETQLEQADGTTHLRNDPESTAVTMPEPSPDTSNHNESLADTTNVLNPDQPADPALATEQRATEDQALADQAYHVEEPNAPEL